MRRFLISLILNSILIHQAESRTLVRTDTIKVENDIIFICQWFRLSNEDLDVGLDDGVYLSTDTVYDCTVAVLKCQPNSENKIKVTVCSNCVNREKDKQTLYLRKEDIERHASTVFRTYCLGQVKISIGRE